MTVNPRQSFKLKLCLSVLLNALFIFLIIGSTIMYFTSKVIKDDVESIISSKLILATRALDDELEGVEIASANLIGLGFSPYFTFSTANAGTIGKAFLEANPNIQGICIGYEDGSDFNQPGPYCPYLMRKNGEFIRLDLSELKDFRSAEWYKTPFETGKPSWSKPFMESNGTLITSYNVPKYDEETGNFYCVVAVDMNLNNLSDSLQLLRPYAGSNLYLIDKDGRFVAHPDHNKVLENAPDYMVEFADSDEDYYVDKSEGHQVYYFHGRIPRTGWTVILSVPRRAMVEHPTDMMNTIVVIMLLGILLLLGSSLYIIGRLTKPLEQFAEAAREISHGDFNVDLPAIKDHNELYDLRNALASMGVSLDQYVQQLEETNGQKVAIEKELDIARNIQMAMVPKIFPPYPDRDNLDIFASLTPAQAVGGDLYDFVLLDNKFFFCIGDVSGKGVPASLFMAITRTLFRNNVAKDRTPSEIAKTINNTLADGNEYGMFVTMIIASFDIVTGELKICNCGHNLPVTNGKITDPKTMTTEAQSDYHLINGLPANIAVGVMPDFDYKDITMNITPGCMLLLYTDGVTEAENKDYEQYDESGMLSLVNSMGLDCDSRSLINALLADVKKFAGNAKQSDDITMLCIRCNRLGQ